MGDVEVASESTAIAFTAVAELLEDCYRLGGR